MLSIDVGVEFEWVFDLFNSLQFLLLTQEWFSYTYDKKVVTYIDTNPSFDFNEVFKYTESLRVETSQLGQR